MKKLSVIFITLLLANFVFSQKKTEQLDNLFTALSQEGAFNGNVLVAENGNIVYEKSFGIANETTKKRLTSKSVFNLASITKQFTAMAIVLLEKDGKLSYNDKITKYIPELEFYNEVTIKDLLLHTGGIPDYMKLMEKHWDKNKIANNSNVVNYFAKYKPTKDFEPGAKFRYSNTGYALLATIIEKASGKTYADFLKKKIFKPLKMKNTNVYKVYLDRVNNKELAFGYLKLNTSKKIKPEASDKQKYVFYLDGVVGQGRIYSTTHDLLIWDRALYKNKLISKEDKKLIFSSGKTQDGKETSYGFGWFTSDDDTYGKSVSHSGRWGGYITYIDRHLDNDKTIIILQNNETSKTRLPLQDVRKILYNLPIEKEFEISLETLKKYSGEYKGLSRKKRTIVRNILFENEKLFVKRGSFHLRLIALSKTKFRVEGFRPEVTLEFTLDDKGKVLRFRERQPKTGVDVKFNRTK